MAKLKVCEIDVSIGERLREGRMNRGLSLDGLAKAIGVTYQQVQKYERGLNRISAASLYRASIALQLPIGWFFEDGGE